LNAARAFAVFAAVALTGCYRGSARTVSPADISREQGWQLAHGVPMIRQSSEHACGAAALAMVLERWGVASDERSIVGASGAGDQPIAAGFLRDLARRKGLSAFLIQGELTDLVREVGLDRPVLIGVVQRYTHRSYSHYEVVVGVNQVTRRVLMLDPGRGMREDAFDSFTTEWGAAGRLTLVIAPR
jgi:ABC-type bacteriocin/lantibiotic exporter with double-glycine peptidase domain